MAIHDDLMIVGAYRDTTLGSDAGAAFVFRRDSGTGEWIEEAKLFGSDTASLDEFGRSVATDGTRILIGAPLHDGPHGTNSGAAYVFAYDVPTGQWEQEQKLVPGTGASSDYFGSAVGLVDDVALVGAPRSDVSANNCGTAFVFRYQPFIQQWLEEEQLIEPNAESNDEMGHSILMEGPTRVNVGVPSDTVGASRDGSVAVWEFDGAGWTLTERVFASGSSRFGESLALDGDRLLIGAPHSDVNGHARAGAAYVFERNGGAWLEQARLVAAIPEFYARIGRSVSVDGDLILVGAPEQNENTTERVGFTHLFRRSGNQWFADIPLAGRNRLTNMSLGASVQLTDKYALCGAPGAAGGAGAILRFSTDEFQMEISDSDPDPGDSFEIKAQCGYPSDPILIVVAEVNGMPDFRPVVLWVFGSDYAFAFNVQAPNPAYDVNLGLQAYKLSAMGGLALSNISNVSL